MTFIIFGLLVVGIIAFISLKPDTATIVTISSKHVVDNYRPFYVAKKKGDESGNQADHWDYYNDSGDKIRDKELMSTLFEVFKEEDWYGDFDFYVDDSKFLSDTIVEDDEDSMTTVVEHHTELEEEEVR